MPFESISKHPVASENSILQSQSRKALMICYTFPPVGGAGVQRSVKFTKYLEQFGWTPTVLTVQNPSVPVYDRDLEKDVPKDIKVLRARSLEPSYRIKKRLSETYKSRSSANALEHTPHQTPNPLSKRKAAWWKRVMRTVSQRFLQPDMQVLWNRSAYRTASRNLKRHPVSVLYVSGPPFSSFLIGCRLKKTFRLPLVLDFRDEWSLSAKYLENQQSTESVFRKQMQMFESILVQADAIIATTQASADELAAHCRRLGSTTLVRCIYNGYDPQDVPAIRTQTQSNEPFRLVYTGTLWRLTNALPIVQALEQLVKQSPEIIPDFEFHLIGRRTDEQDQLLNRLDSANITLCRHPYLPHQEALELAVGADALLLLLADEAGAERVVPAKLFEYLSLRRPILGITPKGEANSLLSKSPIAQVLPPNDVDSIAAYLHKAISEKKNTQSIEDTNSMLPDIDWCSRVTLTAQLADVFNQVAKK